MRDAPWWYRTIGTSWIESDTFFGIQGDKTGFFFEGNYTKYDENRLQRLGEWCIKYAPLVNAEKMPHAPAGVPWFEQTKLDRWSG